MIRRVLVSSIVAATILASSVAWAKGPSLAPLPAPPSPAGNPTTPAKVELGKKLFFDRRLSGDGTMACGTCHAPEQGWGDAIGISLNYPTTRNWRNSPTILNVAWKKTLFWDGRSKSLEEQALFPMMSPFEMNRNLDYMEEALKEVPEYVEAFKAIFGGEINRERVGMAIAAFERTIVSGEAPLDRFLKGDASALTSPQKAGHDLFVGKAKCVTCHNGPTLADGKFHATDVPEDEKFVSDPRVAATRRFVGKVSGFKEYRTLTTDPGRFLVTKKKADWKAFATPPLRDVAKTAPYMHNGAFKTLAEVVDFKDKSSKLGLTADEKATLVTFMDGALTGKDPLFKMPEVP